MTLHTKTHLTGPVGPESALHLAVTALLAAGGGVKTEPSRTVRIKPHAWIPGVDTFRQFEHEWPAAVEVQWRRDGALFIPNSRVPVDEYDVDDEYEDSVPWLIEISWQTAYGYLGPRGETCGQLHAAALHALHRLLPEGVRMRWQHEYDGSWFDGVDGTAVLGPQSDSTLGWMIELGLHDPFQGVGKGEQPS